MLRRIVMAGVLLALPILSACEDKDTSGPDGTPGTVAVRAYVDSDGSGTFNEGDVVIADAPITLTSGVDVTGQATTDAEGIATFEDVPPGSYTAAFGGTPPEGAVLASASGPVVVVPFLGGDVTGEFRYVFNPGSISGQLFRDNNGNGVFDAGDTPAPGTEVLLFRGTDTTGVVINADTTDAQGAFSFPVVRGGDYTLLFHAFPTITLVGGNTQAVSVAPQQVTLAPVRFTGSLLSTIAEARANNPLDSALVAVEGVVGAGIRTFDARSIYIQDATAGILVFRFDTTNVKPQVGDRVRVVGTVVAFNDELEIINPTVTILGAGPAPAPRVVTGAQINTFQFQGELASISRVQVTTVGGGTNASFDVRAVDGAGTEFVIRVNGSTGLTRANFTVGAFYDITGIMNRFRTTGQIAPRAPADVVPAAASISIAEARTLAAGDTVLIEGVVTAGTGVFSTNPTGNQFNVQDATGGILILDTPHTAAAPGPQEGDSVSVRGVLELSSGELLIRRPVISDLGTGTVPAPLYVTGAHVAASTAADPLQGMLVHTNNLLVTAVSGTPTSTSFNVTVQEPAGGTFVLRVGAAATGIAQPFFQVGTRYDVTGLLANFNGAQIKLRSSGDVAVSTATNVMTIAAAEARPNADTVEVEGIVTAGQGGFSNGVIYIQDGTGGLQIFTQTGGPTGIATGDAIRVRGAMGTFNGERQVTRFSTTSQMIVTELGVAAVPAPQVITGAQLASRDFEGELVRVNDLTVASVGAVDGTGRYTVNVTAPDATAFAIRMESPTGSVPAPAIFTVGSHYDVTGIAAGFGNTTTVEQLKPRTAADIVAR